MIPLWGQQRAGFNFDFGASLPSGWTFTRASSGTYLPTAATLATASTDVARFDALGYLNEPAATNLLLRSQLVGGTLWAVAFNNAGFAVNTNNAVAPDGTTTATQCIAQSVGAAQYSITAQQVTSTAAGYSRAIWLKGAVGGETVYFMSTLGTSSYTKTTCVLTTSWQRFKLENVTETAVGWWTYIGVDRRDGTQADPGAITYYVWQAGDELGTFTTSDIVTVGSTATRAADNLTYTLSQLPALQTAAGYGVAIDFSLLGASQNANVVIGLSAVSGFTDTIYVSLNASGQVIITSVVGGSGVSGAATNLNSIGSTNKFAVSVTPAGLRYSINGSAVVAVVNVGQPAMITAAVGRASWAASNYAGMHATRVTLYPGPLSDAALIARAT